MPLAQSRTAVGDVVPLAHGDRWFDVSPLTGSAVPETLTPAGLSGTRAAIAARELPEIEPGRYAPSDPQDLCRRQPFQAA